MRRYARLLLLVLPLAALAACGQHGIFRDRGFDYLRAEAGKPLVYPDGLTPIPAQELYPVPDVDKRAVAVPGTKARREIPPPPQVTVLDDPSAAPATAPRAAVEESRVLLTRDGNGYPVLMLDIDFDWAWQEVGDSLKKLSAVKVDDLDRERGIYYVIVNDRKNSAGDPWQLKLNYTANGIQVALQVDENAMAPTELSEPLMKQLRDEILKP